MLNVVCLSYSAQQELVSGETWGATRTKINANDTELYNAIDTKMTTTTYDSTADGVIDESALPNTLTNSDDNETISGTWTFGNFKFSQITTPTYSQGMLFYSSSEDTLIFYDSNSGTSIEIVREDRIDVFNSTGATIADGSICSTSGNTGDQFNAVLADKDTVSDHGVIGVATYDIETGTSGEIVSFGKVHNQNTTGSVQGETWAVDNPLYVGDSGMLTNVKPTSGKIIYVGTVLRVHSSEGTIFVNIGSAINASDITTGTLSDSIIPSTITRDTEWDTAAKINAATTDTDFVLDTDIGVSVQAWDADLGTYAGITPSANVQSLLAAATYQAFLDLLAPYNLSPTGDVDFSGANSFTSGPIAFTWTATLPSTPTDGQAVYYTGGTFDVFGMYFTDTWQYFLAFDTFPDTDGYIPVYRTATGIGWEAQSGVGGDSVSIDSVSVTDPDFVSTGDIDFVDTSNTVTANINAGVIETTEINATTLITSSETGTTATDTQIPTWKAVKDYLDSIIVSGLPIISITTPATSGIWVDSATYTSLAGTAFDLQGISEIAWKLESGGTYATTGVSGTTSWTVSSITLSEGTNNVYARVTDTDTNTEEDTTVINVDTIDPVNSDGGTDTTHDGSTLITLDVDNNDTNEVTCTYSSTELSLTDVAMTTTGSTGAWNVVDSSIDPNSSTNTIDLVVTCTDPAGNFDTDTYNVTYSAPAAAPDYQWNLDDNAATSVVSATYGSDATFFVATTETNTSTVYDGTVYLEGSGSFKLPAGGNFRSTDSTLMAYFTDGVFTIEFKIYGDTGGSETSYPRFVDTATANSLMMQRYGADTTIRVYLGGVFVADITVDDIDDAQWHTIRLVCDQGGDADGSGNDVAIYQKTGTGSWSLAGSAATFTSPTAFTVMRFYSDASGANSWGSDTNDYYADQVQIWDSAVIP